MTWTLRDDVTALAATLDAERDALLAGALDRLEPLSRRKERLLEALSHHAGPQRTDSQRMEKIRREIAPRLDRNRALLEAAGAGLRAALSELRPGPAETFGTYGADGRRVPEADAGARGAADGLRMERRA